MNNLKSSTGASPTAPLASDGPEPGVPLLQMRGITKSFFGVPVLDAVDLDVMPGEIHAIVGVGSELRLQRGVGAALFRRSAR